MVRPPRDSVGLNQKFDDRSLCYILLGVSRYLRVRFPFRKVAY